MHRLVGDLLDITRRGVEKLVTQVGQRAGHGELVTDLGCIAMLAIMSCSCSRHGDFLL